MFRAHHASHFCQASCYIPHDRYSILRRSWGTITIDFWNTSRKSCTGTAQCFSIEAKKTLGIFLHENVCYKIIYSDMCVFLADALVFLLPFNFLCVPTSVADLFKLSTYAMSCDKVMERCGGWKVPPQKYYRRSETRKHYSKHRFEWLKVNEPIWSDG